MELVFIFIIFMIFYYINYVVVGLILRKLYNNKLSNQVRIKLIKLLDENLFQNLLVLSLSLEKKLYYFFH